MLRGHELSRRIPVDDAATEIHRRPDSDTTREDEKSYSNPKSLRGNHDGGNYGDDEDDVSISRTEIRRTKSTIEKEAEHSDARTDQMENAAIAESIAVEETRIRVTRENREEINKSTTNSNDYKDAAGSSGGDELVTAASGRAKTTRKDSAISKASNADNDVSTAKSGIDKTAMNDQDVFSPIKQSRESNQGEDDLDVTSPMIETAHDLNEQPNLEFSAGNQDETVDAASSMSKKKVTISTAIRASDAHGTVTESIDTNTTVESEPRSEFEDDERSFGVEQTVETDSMLNKGNSPSTALRMEQEEEDNGKLAEGTDEERTVAIDSMFDKDPSPSTSSERKDQDENEKESTHKKEGTTVEAASTQAKNVTSSPVSKANAKAKDDEVTESTEDDSKKNVKADSKPVEGVTPPSASKSKDDDNDGSESSAAAAAGGAASEKNVEAGSKLDEVATSSNASKRKDGNDVVTESTAAAAGAANEKNVVAESKLDEAAATSSASKVKDEDDDVTESTAAARMKNLKDDSKPDEHVTTSTASKVNDEGEDVSESTSADSQKNAVADSKLDEDVTTSSASKSKDEDADATESTAAGNVKNVKLESKLEEVVTTISASKMRDQDDFVTKSTAAAQEKNVKADPKVTTTTATKMKDEDDEVTKSAAVAASDKNVEAESKLDEAVTTSMAPKKKDEDDEVTESGAVAASDKNVQAESKLDEAVTTSAAPKMKDEDDEVTETGAVAASEKNVEAESKLDEVVTTSTASKVKDEDDEITESTGADSGKNVVAESKLNEDATTSAASKVKDEDDEITESTDKNYEKAGQVASTLHEDSTASMTSHVKDNNDEKTVTAASALDGGAANTTASTVKDEDDEVTESTYKDVAKTVTAASSLDKNVAATTLPKVKDEDDEVTESTYEDVAKTVTAASSLDKNAAATTLPKVKDEDDEVTESTAADNANTFLANSAKDGTTLPTGSKMKDEDDDDEVTQTSDNQKTIEAESISNRDDTTPAAPKTKGQDDEVIQTRNEDVTAETDSALEKNATLSTAFKAKDEHNGVTGPFDGSDTAKEVTMSAVDDTLGTENNDDASLNPHPSDGGEIEKAAAAENYGEVASKTNGEEIINKETTPSAESKLMDDDTEITEGTDEDSEPDSLDNESNGEQVSILGDEVARPQGGETVGSGSGHQDLVNAVDEMTPFTAFNASVADASTSTTEFSFENLECKDQHDYVYNGKGDARRWMRILSSEPVDEDDDSYKPADKGSKISSGGQSNFSTVSSAIEDSTEPVRDCSYIAKHREICSEVVRLHLHEGSLFNVNSSLSSGVEDAIAKAANSADDATGGVDNNTNLATIAVSASMQESPPRTYNEDDDDDDDDDAGKNNQVRRTKLAADESDMNAATVDVSSEGKSVSQELNILNYTSSAEDNVVASASAQPSDESGSESKIVITIGSMYCPVSCNAVSQCEVARDHFMSLNHGKFVDAVSKEETAVADATYTSTEGGGSTPSTDLSPKEGSFPKDIDGATVDNEETSVGGGEPANEDEEIPLCSDDPTFLYKGYNGYNCNYIKENKPEKCLKEHNGKLIGVVSCPVSCKMIDKCKALYSVEDHVVGKTTSAPEKVTEEDVAADDVDHEKELSASSLPSDNESSIKTPNEEETIGSNELGGVCKDDPTFLYKDFEGYDCNYLKENKPEKCFKEHNGQLIGVVSCPVSCSMVKQCQDALDKSGNANTIEDDVDGKEGSADVLAETIDFSNAEDIKGKVDHESSEDAGLVNIKDMNSEVIETAGTVSSGGKESSAKELVPFTTDQASSTSNEVVENAADNGKRPVSVSSCKDDPTFRYKDKDGYTCQFIGSFKADKCEKEHNGLMIGIYSCPESCGMVDQCLQASEIATYSAAPKHDPCKDLSTFRFDGEPDKDCLWLSQHEKCELEHDETGMMIGKYFCPEACGLLEASCFVGQSGNASLSNNSGADPASTTKGSTTTLEYNSNEEGISGRDDDGYGVQSSSENEDAKAYAKNDQDLNSSVQQDGKLDEKWEVLEQEVHEQYSGDTIAQQDQEHEINKEPGSSSAVWAEARIGEDFKETSNTGFGSDDEMDATKGPYKNSFNSETKYEDDDGYAYGGGGFGDYNYGGVNGYGYEDESSLSNIGIVGSFTEENSDGNNNGYEYHEPSNASWNIGGQEPGKIVESNNWSNPSAGHMEGNAVNLPSETWDDEDDSFPVGMILLFFVLLAVFLYSKNSRAANSSQGRYQRVEVIDRNMYMNKRR